MFTNFEEIQSIGKEGYEASVESATVLGKGLQDIATQFADFSQKSFEGGFAAAEKAMASKSVDKALEVQTAYAKEAYEGYVGEVTKLGEMYTAVAKEAYKPFEPQVAAFTETATKAAKTVSKAPAKA